MELNTHNPEYLTGTYEEINFSLLGGIRIEGLDRLRVTLKIEYRTLAIRHNLDLYNDSQVEKLIKKTAERFGMGPGYIGKALSELINEVEGYRLREIEKHQQKQDTRKILTEKEREEAIQFLQQPNLLEITNQYIGESGVIGEEENRLLMYLIFTSRKTSRPLHVVSFGSSGAGKSHLQEKVGELIPTEDKIEITSLTGNAFYYFDKDELGHKLVLIEDLDGALAALYPIRELQSKQKISKTVTVKDQRGNAKTIHLVVHGPVCIAGCTTQERIYEDNANRSFLLHIDESERQDEAVMQYQRQLSAGKVNTHRQREIRKLLQNTQRILQPVTVINPYAEQLTIPKEVFKPRRTNAHYIAFIEAITFYRQYQREPKGDPETGELYIETTLEDIEEANRLIKPILLRKSDELSGAGRTYFEKLKTYLKEQGETVFTNSQIRKALRENPSNQKRYMVELQQYGYVRRVEEQTNTGNQKKGFYYQVSSYEEYGQLETKVNTLLDQILTQLKETVQSSQAVQTASEPLNKQKASKKVKQSTES